MTAALGPGKAGAGKSRPHGAGHQREKRASYIADFSEQPAESSSLLDDLSRLIALRNAAEK
jgi:hypothetical protein